MELILFLISVIIISLSGVLMPGPVFAVTLAKSYKSRFAGSLIALGHGIIEIPLIFLIYFGFGDLFKINLVRTSIGVVGGTTLIWMGINLIRMRAALIQESKDLPYNSTLAGIITTAGNPYFFLWWATIGIALIMKSMAYGLIGFISLAIVHWLCDFGWYSLVGLAIHQTKRLWNKKFHELVFSSCGLILLGFGTWFIWSAL